MVHKVLSLTVTHWHLCCKDRAVVAASFWYTFFASWFYTLKDSIMEFNFAYVCRRTYV